MQYCGLPIPQALHPLLQGRWERVCGCSDSGDAPARKPSSRAAAALAAQNHHCFMWHMAHPNITSCTTTSFCPKPSTICTFAVPFDADIDDCVNNPCLALSHSDGTCRDVPAPGRGFICGCEDKYAWNASTTTCYGKLVVDVKEMAVLLDRRAQAMTTYQGQLWAITASVACASIEVAATVYFWLLVLQQHLAGQRFTALVTYSYV